MQLETWDELSRAPAFARRTALTIGVFDGVHRGHQALLQKITGKAPELIPVVVTFRENPKKTARGSPIPSEKGSFEGDILSFEEKIALFEDLGVELCLVIDFSENFSKIEGRSFLETLRRFCNPAYIALGTNFHCGYRRETGAVAFKAMAEAAGIAVEIILPVLEGGAVVSSSRIRAALRAGRKEEAEQLLGRPVLDDLAARFRQNSNSKSLIRSV